MTRFWFVLVAGWFAAGPAAAAPPTIDRTLGKEPVYRSASPRYGLLAFGPEGTDRVWLVLDGKTLYVDRDGDGDLTDPEDRVTVEANPGSDPETDGFLFEVGTLTVGGRTHKGLRVGFTPLLRYADGDWGQIPYVKAALANDPKTVVASLSVDVDVPGRKGGGLDGRLAFQAGPIDVSGVFQFAATPADAPVVRLGAPLTISFYGDRPTLRVGEEGDLVLVVGTPGVGPGTFAMLGYTDTIPPDAHPKVRLVLPAARWGGPPIEELFELKQRC